MHFTSAGSNAGNEAKYVLQSRAIQVCTPQVYTRATWYVYHKHVQHVDHRRGQKTHRTTSVTSCRCRQISAPSETSQVRSSLSGIFGAWCMFEFLRLGERLRTSPRPTIMIACCCNWDQIIHHSWDWGPSLEADPGPLWQYKHQHQHRKSIFNAEVLLAE